MVVFKEEKGVRVKSWPEEDRPREKLLRKGRRSLSNAELMAILINSGNKDESSVTVCRHILNVYQNNLDMLGSVGQLLRPATRRSDQTALAGSRS